MDVYYQPRLASTSSIHRYKQTNNIATENNNERRKKTQYQENDK